MNMLRALLLLIAFVTISSSRVTDANAECGECSADARVLACEPASSPPPRRRPKSSSAAKSPAGPKGHFQGPCASDPDGKRFAAKACVLASGFDPANAPFGPSYRRPTCDGSQQVDERQRELLAGAYRIAPDYAKAKLCRLTQLFITGSSYAGGYKGSWGLWEARDRAPGTGTFIGVPASRLGGTPSFAAFETDSVAALLGVPRSPLSALPSFTAAADDPAIATLDILAHELGHILLADTNGDGTNTNHPRVREAGAAPPPSACFERVFLRRSWNAEGFYRSMRRWVELGDQKQNTQVNIRFNLSSVRGNSAAANEAIQAIYGSREFVSVHAAVSPEEDFVETYKYKVLADARQPLTIQFESRRTQSARSFIATGTIAEKVACLRALGLFSTQR